MQFLAKYYSERLKIVNPEGDTAVVTLWSTVESVLKVLEALNVDLSISSRIAVIANLYGNGLPHMIRNLLYNPQIRNIVICGHNLSGSKEWLINFFSEGLEEVEFLGSKAFRIKGTNRIIDGEVRPENFTYRIQFGEFGKIGEKKIQSDLKAYFDTLPSEFLGDLLRVEPPIIPEPEVTRFPSEPRSHTIVRDTPLEAWSELIFRLYRFGHRNTVAKSTGLEQRIELQNVHVVVERPLEESEEVLSGFGFDLEGFRRYQDRILDSIKPKDLKYTYGNRLRGYFKYQDQLVDSLVICGNRLKLDPDSRHAYVSLWDNARDLSEGKGCPCFVSCFFRKFEGKLTLTATFRAHNAMDAWPENFYGLMAIQCVVAELAGMETGSITVISHSISIDPSALSKAKQIAEKKKTDEVVDFATGKSSLRFDPNGEFTATFDKATWELVVEHSYQGMKIGEYRGKTAEEVELQLSRDNALSIISHALYLGRVIARKEFEMKVERTKQS